MSQAPTFGDLLLRVLLTAVGGALIGFDRGRGGRPAGMRTTLLVCLAACLSMLEANLLLATGGKTSSSFASMDVMRLPLGILSGMGFIGAGAILQKGNLVRGLTTAATLWFVTVMGICFGGGQLLLGLSALGLGLATLWGLKPLEERAKQEQRGVLVLTADGAFTSERDLRELLGNGGYRIRALAWEYDVQSAATRTFTVQLSWRARAEDLPNIPMFERFAQAPGVTAVKFRPDSLEAGANED